MFLVEIHIACIQIQIVKEKKIQPSRHSIGCYMYLYIYIYILHLFCWTIISLGRNFYPPHGRCFSSETITENNKFTVIYCRYYILISCLLFFILLCPPPFPPCAPFFSVRLFPCFRSICTNKTVKFLENLKSKHRLSVCCWRLLFFSVSIAFGWCVLYQFHHETHGIRYLR